MIPLIIFAIIVILLFKIIIGLAEPATILTKGLTFHSKNLIKEISSKLTNLGLDNNIHNNLPKILYKFRSWDNEFHKSLLANQQIYFSSPKDLNDPFDCRNPINFENFTADERKQFVKKNISLLSDNLLYNKVLATDLNLIEEQTYKNYLKKYSEHEINSILKNKNNVEFFSDSEINNFGIFSLCEYFENSLMWAHYANSLKGYCVGLDTKSLDEIFTNLPNEYSKYCGLGSVSYNENISISPKDLTTNTYIKEIFLKKRKEWCYEKEWRFLYYFSIFDSRIFNISKDVFKEIYLGPLISKTHKNEILEILKKELPNVKIYQIKINRLGSNLYFKEMFQ